MTVRLPIIDRTPRVDELSIVSWNVKVGRPSYEVVSALRQIIRDHDPEVICLQEAKGHAPELRVAFGKEWRILARRGWGESDNCITMVRRTLGRVKWRTLRMRHWWRGPKANLLHPGRTFPIVDIGGRFGWRIVNVHRTKPQWDEPGGSAYLEEHLALIRLAGRSGSHYRALLIVGDQNADISDLSPRSPATLAKTFGAKLIRTNAKVDWAAARGARGSGGRDGNHGSDHPMVSFHFVRTRREGGQ